MTCSYCHRQHAAGVLCQGVSRRSFFFFGMAFGVAGAQACRSDLVDQQIADFVQGEVGPAFQVEPFQVANEPFQVANHPIKSIERVYLGDGVDLSTHIQEIDFDAIHRRIEAGERDLFGRPVTGLKDLEPFKITLSGFWEGVRPGKG